MRALAAIACTGLMACQPAGVPIKSDPIPYVFDASGVQLLDRPQRIDFGRTDHSAIPAMTKLIGRGPVEQGSCGDITRVTWQGDVTLFMKAGEFRGWQSGAQAAGTRCPSSPA